MKQHGRQPLSQYKHIIFEREGTTTRITFNRPHAHNALDRVMSDELADAVRAVKKDRECRFLVFRGAGDTFCAGRDHKGFSAWKGQGSYWEGRQEQETAEAIERLTCNQVGGVGGAWQGG